MTEALVGEAGLTTSTVAAESPLAPAAGEPRVKRQGTSLALETYHLLRDDVINARLEPDAHLRIRELCERYGAGLSPIREALSRLASEGLVVQSAQRGFTVASFSLNAFDELVRTRMWIDERGLREAIEHGDAAWEEAVVLAYHRLSRTPRHSPEDPTIWNPAWYGAHATFHRTLIAACRSQWLIDFSQHLFDAIERYRALVRVASGERRTHLDEHRLITDAAVARDTEQAVRRLQDHYALTASLVRSRLEHRTLHAR